MTEIACLFIAVTKRYLRIGVYDFVLVERKTVVRFASELQFQKLIISFDELLTAVKGYFDFVVDREYSFLLPFFYLFDIFTDPFKVAIFLIVIILPLRIFIIGVHQFLTLFRIFQQILNLTDFLQK